MKNKVIYIFFLIFLASFVYSDVDTFTATFVIIADALPPTLTVYSPVPAGTYTSAQLLINFTATDISGISTLWYYNGTGNVTNSSQTITLTQGTYSFDFYANDTAGNLATKSISFTISLASTPTTGGGGTHDSDVLSVTSDGYLLSVCKPKPTLIERLRDKCSYNNSICEDGELPSTQIKDCNPTLEAITCDGDRCIFQEIWFTKLVLLILLFLILFFKREYRPWILLITVFLLVMYSPYSLFPEETPLTIPELQPVPVLSSEICPIKESFIDRLQDKCSFPNAICEDGEIPSSKLKDCNPTFESLTCKGVRCIFQEMWFAKLLFIILIFLIMFYKKQYRPFIGIIILLLLFNFSTTESAGLLRQDLINMAPDGIDKPSWTNKSIPPALLSNLSEYGGKVVPGRPAIGVLVIFMALIFVINYLFDKGKNLRRKRKWR